MSLIPTWPILVFGSVLAFAAGVAADHTIMAGRIDRMKAETAEVDRQRAEIRAADERDSRTKEQTWAARVGQVEQEKTNENARIAARYAVELDGLRKRADRRPAPSSGTAPAAASCEGANGAELSREDSQFLAGEAARADRQRAALGACYNAYDAIK